jgi:hypothetical protein
MIAGLVEVASDLGELLLLGEAVNVRSLAQSVGIGVNSS